MTRDDEITLLKWTAAMEAENQKYAGMSAVCWAIMNRVRLWKKSVSDVILTAYQFNAWDSQSPTRLRLDTISDAVMGVAEQAAREAYAGDPEKDPTKGSTLYHNPKTAPKPKWDFTQLTFSVSIGDHDFYKENKYGSKNGNAKVVRKDPEQKLDGPCVAGEEGEEPGSKGDQE